MDIRNNQLRCIMTLRPSEESCEYLVKIVLHKGYKPSVWLMEPSLQLVNDKLPHHIYGFDGAGKPKLCVYHPSEWNDRMFIAESFVPWVITWLNTYEYWVLTGKWHYDEVHRQKKA